MLSLPRFLTALPVYNEHRHVNRVLDEVVRYADDVLVVDDGSSDGTAELLAKRPDVAVVRHSHNLGYGGALKTAFGYAIAHNYQALVTIDCDGQHEPQRIRQLAAKCSEADIVSGSRYLDEQLDPQGIAPEDRRRINMMITAELNKLLGLELTDAFCGFKAYRVSALAKLDVTELGYAMPLELWVQAAYRGLSIREVAVPRIYLDEKRSFGGTLDDAEHRLTHYREVIARAIAQSRTMESRATPSRTSPASAEWSSALLNDEPY